MNLQMSNPLTRRFVKNTVFILLGIFAVAGCRRETESDIVPGTGIRNVVLIGWDGCQRSHMEDLLRAGSLPNLKKLIDEGGYVHTRVTTGATVTKPGWAEILTGYSAERLKITSNRNFAPIPRGYTVFERFKDISYGKMAVIFIGGKINNIGHRGPHKICKNCITRDPITHLKTFHWDENAPQVRSVPTAGGGPQRWVPREGEPYFNVHPVLDCHKTALGSAEHVGPEALSALESFKGRPFFAFFHFEEPDEQGHVYGENSREYSEAIRTADVWLGRIVAKLRRSGIYETTAVFVVSDHGMDEDGNEHFNAPETFLVTNLKKKLRSGDRKDVTPTLLQSLGINADKFRPRLEGRSLIDD
ncbi:MAG: alkaline phosphatase family protein [bacterium]